MKTELILSPTLADALLDWYAANARDLPWRRDNDPYRVWVSEIMLQQTRVEAVKAYYLRFLEEVPSICALAELSEERLMKLWEGLGYYSRARNLQRAARFIVHERGGHFPSTYKELLQLPGIGAYTAGAIASICFGKPTPAVDGNVLRLISRIAGISEPMDTPEMKQRVAAALERIYPADRTGDFTQSLMELGATICLPNGQPKCGACPVAHLCTAFAEGKTADYPIRTEKKEKTRQIVTVLILSCEGKLAIRRRNAPGLLAGMWELPNVVGELDAKGAFALAEEWGANPISITEVTRLTHVFTHIRWDMVCYFLDCAAQPDRFLWANRDELNKTYALPTAFWKILQKKIL